MDKLVIILLILTIYFPCSATGQVPSKMAFLIGAGEQAAGSSWGEIHAAEDVILVERVLEQQGFDRIHTLVNRAATKAQITSGLRALSPPRGSTLLLFYSGHGDRLPNQDEHLADPEPDGMDEALVPYGAPHPSDWSPDYKGERHLRDDELHILLTDLRKQIGPMGELLLVVDACFSGEIDREGWKRTDLPCIKSGGRLPDEGTYLKGGGILDGHKDAERVGGFAPLISITACRADQISREVFKDGHYYGPLTYAFCKALAQCQPGQSYAGLFQRIQAHVHADRPFQHPQLEGAIWNRVFGGELATSTSYFLPDKWLDGQHCLVGQGTFSGLGAGAKVALYPVGTELLHPEQQLGTGRVSQAQAFGAELEWETQVPDSIQDRAWVFLIERALGDLQMGLDTFGDGSGVMKTVVEQLEEEGFVSIGQNNPLLSLRLVEGNLLLRLKGKTVFQRSTQEGRRLPVVILELKDAVFNCAQSHFLGTVLPQMKDRRFETELFIWNSDGAWALAREANGQALPPAPDFQVGDTFFIQVRNTGREPLYYSLLHLEPERPTLLIPFRGASPERFYLMPGEDHTWDQDWFFYSPSKESFNAHFLLIASPQALDLREVIAPPNRGEDIDPQLLSDPIARLIGRFLTQLGWRSQSPTLAPSPAFVSELIEEIHAK